MSSQGLGLCLRIQSVASAVHRRASSYGGLGLTPLIRASVTYRPKHRLRSRLNRQSLQIDNSTPSSTAIGTGMYLR